MFPLNWATFILFPWVSAHWSETPRPPGTFHPRWNPLKGGFDPRSAILISNWASFITQWQISMWQICATHMKMSKICVGKIFHSYGSSRLPAQIPIGFPLQNLTEQQYEMSESEALHPMKKCGFLLKRLDFAENVQAYSIYHCSVNFQTFQ